MDISKLTTAQRISAVAILVIILSAFLPWVSFFGISALGIEGDGVITLILAVSGGVVLSFSTELFGLSKISPKTANITLVALAGLAAFVGIFSTANIGSLAAIGVYLTLFGGFAWAAGSVWQLRLDRGVTNSQQTNQAPDESGQVPPAQSGAPYQSGAPNQQFPPATGQVPPAPDQIPPPATGQVPPATGQVPPPAPHQ